MDGSGTLEEQRDQALSHPVVNLNEGDRSQIDRDIRYLRRYKGRMTLAFAIQYLSSKNGDS